MTYNTLADYNLSQGPHMIFVAANEISGGILMPLILFAFFMILAGGSFFMQKKINGYANTAASFTAAAFATTILSFLLLLIPDLIGFKVAVISVVITIACFIWLMFADAAQTE